ncbi:hypothetical protein TWF730_003704 [Orbilia blumenaviensis]|uniref:C3H1-type domain-containing protein n=1 Tax=Orbilia blumenaviensis TaxID=1796055 RepID=A0AAV9U320_9PEZI
MSLLPKDIRNAMATTLCAVMRARDSSSFGVHRSTIAVAASQPTAAIATNEISKAKLYKLVSQVFVSRRQTVISTALYEFIDSYGLIVQVDTQPPQRGDGISAPTLQGNNFAGKAQAEKSDPKKTIAAPKLPGPAPSRPAVAPITRWSAPDPICSNQAERDMISLFRHPMRCPLDLADLERRQMMDYATKLLNHHKPQFQRYAVREMSEPLAQSHFLDVTNILINDETGGHTFGVIIFLTRFIPFVRLLGQRYWRTDTAVEDVFKKFLDTVLPGKVYNIYIIARGIASFIGFQTIESDDIDWPSLYVEMLHCFLNLAKYSRNHSETAGFEACDYWMISFIEQARDGWFGQPASADNNHTNPTPRPGREAIFDELTELVSLYKLAAYFAPTTYEPGTRRRLDDVRRIDCAEWLQTGTCPGAADESCFFAHRARVVDQHADKSDKQFKSMEAWSKFGNPRDIITTTELKAYWDQGLEFLSEGKVDFVFETLMSKEGSFLVEQAVKFRTPNDGAFNFDPIKSFAKIISDTRLEQYNQKQSKVITIADTFIENKKFFVVWANEIRTGLADDENSERHIDAARHVIGLARFTLSLTPINKLDGVTRAALVELCRIIAEHNEETSVSMTEATTVTERLGYLLRKNPQTGDVEIIDRDAPDDNAGAYDDDASLVFSDNVKRFDEETAPVQRLISIDSSFSRGELLVDVGPSREAPAVQPKVRSDMEELIGLGFAPSKIEPLQPTVIRKENIKPESSSRKTIQSKATSDAVTEIRLPLAPLAEVTVVEPPLVLPEIPPQPEKTVQSDDEGGANTPDNQSGDQGEPSDGVSDVPSCLLLEESLQGLADFFKFGLVRPAARLSEMESNGYFVVFKHFYTSEHVYAYPDRIEDDVTIFGHVFNFLETVAHKLAKHDLEVELGWKNIMGALFRKLWSSGEFVEFFRTLLGDFYLLHEDRARFNSVHRKMYRKATENVLRLLLGLAKTQQLPRIDGQFQRLLLRFFRIFTEEYRTTLTHTLTITRSNTTEVTSRASTTGRTRLDRDPQSYHRWTKVHALINLLVAKTGLVGFFKQVPGEVGRDPQPRPLFRHASTFVCPHLKLSLCEFAAHCQYIHEAEDSSSPLEESSDSESDFDTESDSGTERGDEASSRAAGCTGRHRRGTVISASGEGSGFSVNSAPTMIDADDVVFM